MKVKNQNFPPTSTQRLPDLDSKAWVMAASLGTSSLPLENRHMQHEQVSAAHRQGCVGACSSEGLHRNPGEMPVSTRMSCALVPAFGVEGEMYYTACPYVTHGARSWVRGCVLWIGGYSWVVLESGLLACDCFLSCQTH